MADRNRFARRQPGKGHGLTWARFPTVDGSAVIYRLWRRDNNRKPHQVEKAFFTDAEPAHIARVLRQAKRKLRDRVDEIDLEAMEEAA
jgi:hypothetical protein